jgi:hypothetical protein
MDRIYWKISESKKTFHIKTDYQSFPAEADLKQKMQKIQEWTEYTENPERLFSFIY